MGCVFDTFAHTTNSYTAARTALCAHQQEQRDENGSDTYAGHIGISDGVRLTSRKFTERQAAWQWLEENEML